MPETHKEIVKVWIAPGCIVCDACETDCPPVFDVQEETCVIKPAVKDPAFTRALTPSIIVAAEGCPVEVIKYDMIDVEGPEPEAWKVPQEPAHAGAGAGSDNGGGGAAKKGGVIPSGPPDPKWAGLLRTSHTSGSRSAGGAGVRFMPAKAPAEAIAAVLPVGAPPDARDAAMVGSGFARPRLNAADRIRKVSAAPATPGVSRRGFMGVLALVFSALFIGWSAIAATILTFLGAFQDFFVPKVTKEPPTIFRVGRLADYPNPGVYEQYKITNNVWIVRLPDNKLMALSTTCTHLGCIPNWLAADTKFKCPCHGSGFHMDGVNFEGPAPRPLERCKIWTEGDIVMVDKSQRFRSELGQWTNPAAFVAV